MLSYRKWAYVATILTGFSALCAQVLWQRYLAILVGSEARSLTLVVAIFLAGLAAGYYVFGLITERKKWSRRWLLKLYGYVELITALYIICFCIYFQLLKTLSFNSPPYFIIDILVSVLALIFPTFLMGASIPILTAALPNHSKEVNTLHAKIYGWNTLGACFGTLISGFYLLPAFGLNESLILVGIVNLFASLIFIKNPLKGNVHKRDNVPAIPSVLSNRFYLFFTFLTGAIVISFEVFFIRILHLSTQGARVYNFPLILAIFIGGLALGSLSVNNKKNSINHLIQQLINTIFLLGLLFWILPYWPIWLEHIRSSLGFMSDDYIVFQIVLFLFISLFLFPAVFCMGQLLPLTYTLMKKDAKNYGRICGALYFFNTVGTTTGAIGISYLALYILNIDHLFKLNIYILSVLAFLIAFFERKTKYMIMVSIFTIVFLFLPLGWDGSGRVENYPHYVVDKSKPHIPIYKKWFFFPKDNPNKKTTYFNDGPNTTVKMNQYSLTKKALAPFVNPLLPPLFKNGISYSIITNGKSDSNTRGDFSTLFLIPTLPWLFAPSDKKGLSTLVVGLGTGVSAGILGQLDEVKEVDVLEISPKVIEAVRSAPAYLNFNVSYNRKINFIETDAFKYFTKTRKKFDIIASEPSNLWVAGIENLFSLEFYQLAARSLSEKGILGQWIQSYSIDEKTITMILHTLKMVFPYAELYNIGKMDILIIASKNPLPHDFSDKRIHHSFLHPFFKALGIKNKEDIYLAQILNSYQYQRLVSFASKENKDIHSLTRPRLSYLADKTRFTGYHPDPFTLIPEFLIGNNDKQTKKQVIFKQYKNTPPDIWKKRCPQVDGFQFLCAYMKEALKKYADFKDTSKNYLARLNHYFFLRKHGLIQLDNHFLDTFFLNTLRTKYIFKNTLMIYINERINQGNHKIAYEHIHLLKERQIINEKIYQIGKTYIDKHR